jgi:uncharacterized membrane protein YvbJ
MATCPKCGSDREHNEATCARNQANRRKEESRMAGAAAMALRKGTPRIVVVTVLVVGGMFLAVLFAIGYAVTGNAKEVGPPPVTGPTVPSGLRLTPRHP